MILPCDLLMLPGVTPVHKGLTPSGKLKHPFRLFISKLFAYLKHFSKLRMGVLKLMLGTPIIYSLLRKWNKDIGL
jgi:hypothetical protein